MEAGEGAGTARTDPTEILRRLRASVRRAGPEAGAGGRAERYAVIYGILLSAERTPDEYLRALRVAEYAVELVPNAEQTPLWTIKGLAEYRMGRIERALANLEHSWALQQEEGNPLLLTLSATPVVMSMCLARVGKLDEARAMLRGRRSLAGSFPESSFGSPMNRVMRDSTLTLIDEAEALLAGEEGQ